MTDTSSHPCAAALAGLMARNGDLSQRGLVRFLAERGASVALGTVNNLLAGKSPDLDTARKLAQAFGVPAATFLPELAALAPSAPIDPDLRRIPLDRLRLAPDNERKVVAEGALSVLASDIEHRGLLQNLVVYPEGEDFLVYAGGRRWAALGLLDDGGCLPDDIAELGVPCKVLADRRSCLLATIAENAHREEVHYLDRAAAFAKLRTDVAAGGLGMTARQIAEATGLGERAVQMHLQIHDRLPDADRERARKGELTFREARDLVQAHRPAPEPAPAPAEPEDRPLPFAQADIARAFDQVQGERRAPERPVSERLKDVCCKYGEFTRSELNAGTEVNFAAVTDDLEVEFGISISREDAAAQPTLGAMARYIIGRLSRSAAPAAPVVVAEGPETQAAAEYAALVNNDAVHPGGNAASAAIAVEQEEQRQLAEARREAAEDLQVRLRFEVSLDIEMAVRLLLFAGIFDYGTAGPISSGGQVGGLPAQLCGLLVPSLSEHGDTWYPQYGGYRHMSKYPGESGVSDIQSAIWADLAKLGQADLGRFLTQMVADRLFVRDHIPLPPVTVWLCRCYRLAIPDVLLPSQLDIEDAVNAKAPE